jgi:NDP-sugar pyrophosphorylase family protein
MKAMIFAAGVGSRLGEITRDLPKALVDIGGTTPLRLAVERLANLGFNDIIINVHHHAEMIADAVSTYSSIPASITLSDESDNLLDTGGGLFKAKHFFDNEPFLLYNVDIINSIDLGVLYKYHIRKGGLATLAVRHREGNRFLLTDRNGMLRGWTNKQTGKTIIVDDEEKGLSEVAFSGIHVASPKIFDHMQDGVYTMISLYLAILSKGQINTFLDDRGYWYDIGSPEKLEEVRAFMKEHGA